ncbi:MAG TPA: helix-turn-helix domain-containing protein [Pirellulaceae bacterium]
MLLTGPENRLLPYFAEQLLAGTSITTTSAWKTIAIYGDDGLGKSFALETLANSLRARFGLASVQIGSASEWFSGGRRGWESHAETRFLLMDDLETWQTNVMAQRSLVTWLDAAEDARVHLIATLCNHPLRSRLLGTLASRLAGGLTIPLVSPGLATRGMLVDQFALERGIRLDPEAAKWLADRPFATVRELTVAVEELARQFPSQLITARVVKGQQALRRAQASDTALAIREAVARRYAVRVKDLRGSSRRRTIATARGVAIYLIRSLTQTNLREIGELFGARDHSTVLNACRRVRRLLREDPTVAESVSDVLQALRHVVPAATGTLVT